VIRYELSSSVRVALKVFDVLGNDVRTLANAFEHRGIHQVTLDASRMASGVYFYSLTAGSFTDVKKLVVAKWALSGIDCKVAVSILERLSWFLGTCSQHFSKIFKKRPSPC
jgi:hypothetical protein